MKIGGSHSVYGIFLLIEALWSLKMLGYTSGYTLFTFRIPTTMAKIWVRNRAYKKEARFLSHSLYK